MISEEIRDYAMPTMKAEKALKELHNAFLARDMEVAKKKALEASFWALMAWDVMDDPEGKVDP